MVIVVVLGALPAFVVGEVVYNIWILPVVSRAMVHVVIDARPL